MPLGYPKGISGGCATLGLALQSRLECLSFDMTYRWQLDQAEEAYVLFDQQALGKDVITPEFMAAWCQGGPFLLSREER